MEFQDVIEKRHSVRSYENKEIEKEKLMHILEATNRAPSAGNLQSYRIHRVADQEKKEELMIASNEQEALLSAPVVLVFAANETEAASKYGERGAALFSVQDATIACAYAQLAAADIGLGSVWIGAFDPLEVSRICDLESFEVPVAILPIGYPAEEPRETSRKTLDEIVRKA
jgi:nitroreductase